MAAALLLFFQSSLARAALVSNLANGQVGNVGISVRQDRLAITTDYTRRAQSFTTGASSVQFGYVTLSMNDAPGGDGFHVDLHADAAGVPSETPLMPLLGSNNPSTTGLYNYYRSFPLVLLPNTKYWIVAAADIVLPEEEFAWHSTQDRTETGAPGWSLGDDYYDRTLRSLVDSGWLNSGSGALQMSVAEIPEPSGVILSLAFMLLGRGWLGVAKRRHVPATGSMALCG